VAGDDGAGSVRISGQDERKHIPKVVLTDRLVQVAGEARLGELPGVPAYSERRKHQHTERAETSVRTHKTSERLAVHLRHLHIHHGKAERIALPQRGVERRERGASAGDALGAHPPRRQPSGQKPSVGRVVVHDQDAHVPQVGCGTEFAPQVLRLFFQAGGTPEFRALPLCARRADRAAHHLRKLLRDGKPQPRAAVLTRRRGVRLTELREEQSHLLLGDPYPRIAHREAEQRVAVALFHQRDSRLHFPFVRELHRVAHEVGEDLPQTPRIAAKQHGNVRIDAAQQLDPLLLGAHRQRQDKVVHEAGQIEVEDLEVELSGLYLGEVQNIVDEREERFRADPDDLGIPPLLLGQVRIEQQTGHPDDAVHGRADLVAHVCEEFALGNAGGSCVDGQFVGAGSLLLEAAACSQGDDGGKKR